MGTSYKWLALWVVSGLELLMVLAVSVLIFSRRTPLRKPTRFRDIECRLGKLARRRGLAVLITGLLVLTTRGALIPLLGIPRPGGHDEFSFSLAADTFVSGRVTNPTHPMWTHFETFHVIQKPTYMSMYPPAEGLLLAGGRFMGDAWLGQWIITAIMCAALCWMLQAWLPPGWAFFGGVLAFLRLGVMSYWMNTYWAGSLAALGGALIFGALPRLKKRARVRDSVIMAVGLAILANTRPYEGLILTLPVAGAIAIWLLGEQRPIGRKLWRVVAPGVLILTVTAGGMAYYYWRVTGSPFRMTYQVNRAEYATAPYFLWQTPRPEPHYRYTVMRDFYDKELRQFNENRTPLGFVRRTAVKLLSWWGFFLGPALTIPLFTMRRAVRDKRIRFPALAMGLFVIGLSVETFMMPHYFAPATCLVYLLLLQAMRHLSLWHRRTDRRGLALVRAVPVICVGMIVMRLASVAAHASIEPAWPRGNLKRAAIINELNRIPERNLILVRYGPDHNLDDEWVYNGSNVDGQSVVWARDMDFCDNQELLHYYRNRRAWLLEPDYYPVHLQAYMHSDQQPTACPASAIPAPHDEDHSIQ
jgi:hypothetical protein